jgi:hypothetical protein
VYPFPTPRPFPTKFKKLGTKVIQAQKLYRLKSYTGSKVIQAQKLYRLKSIPPHPPKNYKRWRIKGPIREDGCSCAQLSSCVIV